MTLPLSSFGQFPSTRLRRTRRWDWIREMVQENQLSAKNLIWPIFVIEGQGKTEPIATMPGVERMSIDLAVEAAQQAAQLGIGAVAIFPLLLLLKNPIGVTKP